MQRRMLPPAFSALYIKDRAWVLVQGSGNDRETGGGGTRFRVVAGRGCGGDGEVVRITTLDIVGSSDFGYRFRARQSASISGIAV